MGAVSALSIMLLILAGCYREARWRPGGGMQQSLEGEVVQVAWGTQLEIRTFKAAAAHGFQVTRQPLCRSLRRGTARLEERDTVRKKKGVDNAALGLMLGGGLVGAFAFGEETDATLLGAGIGLMALGLVLKFLPDRKRVQRTRTVHGIAWMDQAEPCGEPEPLAGATVRVTVSNDGGSRKLGYQLQTDRDGRIHVAKLAPRRWAANCAESVTVSVSVPLGDDREAYERRRLASRQPATAGQSHGGRHDMELGPEAGAGVDALWATEPAVVAVHDTSTPAPSARSEQFDERFAEIDRQCVIARWERVKANSVAAGPQFGKEALELLPADTSFGWFYSLSTSDSTGKPIGTQVLDEVAKALLEVELWDNGIETRRAVGGLALAGTGTYSDGFAQIIMVRAHYDQKALAAWLDSRGLKSSTVDGVKMWTLDQRRVLLLPGVIGMVSPKAAAAIVQVVKKKQPSLASSEAAELLNEIPGFFIANRWSFNLTPAATYADHVSDFKVATIDYAVQVVDPAQRDRLAKEYGDTFGEVCKTGHDVSLKPSSHPARASGAMTCRKSSGFEYPKVVALIAKLIRELSAGG